MLFWGFWGGLVIKVVVFVRKSLVGSLAGFNDESILIKSLFGS